MLRFFLLEVMTHVIAGFVHDVGGRLLSQVHGILISSGVQLFFMAVLLVQIPTFLCVIFIFLGSFFNAIADRLMGRVISEL